MKKLISLALLGLSLNAAAYFDGGVEGVTGPDGYRGSKIHVSAGSESLWLTPSLSTYKSDSLDKLYRTWALRMGLDRKICLIGAEAGYTPKINGYSNRYIGGDVTVSLTPGTSGRSRLAGPGARSVARGGQGVTRIDVGAGLKHTSYENDISGTTLKTGQLAYSVFAGAKILMAQLAATYTGYSYTDSDTIPLLVEVPGHSFALSAYPKRSVNARMELPLIPVINPFVSYTVTDYKHGVDTSHAYAFGGDIDLNMVAVNIQYQVFNNGSATDSYISLGAGLKF